MIQICDHKLLIFLLLIMSVLACETTEILTFTGYEGGKVEIRCPYESGYEEKNKYLCRGECSVLNKDIPVESGSPAKDRRFSLTDDRTTHIFTVTITDLRTEDQGKYRCGVRTRLGKYDKYTEINLEIKPVSVVSRVTGEHLNITCHYNSDLKNKIKFFCKGSDPSLCESSGIKASSETNSNGRFSLRDDESAGVFTVTITDLTLEDSGIYWCGAGETGQKRKNKWISVTDLNINNEFSDDSARRSQASPLSSPSVARPLPEHAPVGRWSSPGPLWQDAVQRSWLHWPPSRGPGYVPKVPTTPFRDQVVNLQALPSEEADPALALLCPVRALRAYVDRMQCFRTSDQLFVCYGGKLKGKALSKQRLSHWIVEPLLWHTSSKVDRAPLV
ncbi:unnamed protein product [Leuciscus chuanchicus]